MSATEENDRAAALRTFVSEAGISGAAFEHDEGIWRRVDFDV